MNRAPRRSPALNVAAFVLFVAPMLAYWAYCLVLNPFPHYDAIDPEYEYYLNSLGAFKHQPYVYVDHPGTPVEMIGTAILAATYPWAARSPEGFVTYQLQHPQLFLRLAYTFMMLIHLACVAVFFLFGLRSGQAGNAILAAALATMYFAIQPYAFSGSVMWSHNSFSFPFGALLLIGLYASLVADKEGDGVPARNSIGLGFGVGIISAITIFLASWIVGMVAALLLYSWLRGLSWRSVVLGTASFALGTLAGFYIAVLPVVNRMGEFAQWIYSILSHQSDYLAVPANETILQTVSKNIGVLFQMLPALAVAMLITIALAVIALVAWGKQLKEEPALWALIGGLSAQMLALLLVFLDRPLRAYYLLSVAAIVPVLAMAILKIYARAPEARRLLAAGVTIAVLIGLVLNSVRALKDARQQSEIVAKSEKLIQQIIYKRASALNRPAEGMVTLWMYGTYSPCWALWFGNHRTADAFDQEILHICPNQYELAGRILLPNRKAALDSTPWDIVFTCDRYVGQVQAKQTDVIVQVHPEVTWTCGSMAVLFNNAEAAK